MNESSEQTAAQKAKKDKDRDPFVAGFVWSATAGVAVAGWWGSFIGLKTYANDHMGLVGDVGAVLPGVVDGMAFAMMAMATRSAIRGNGAFRPKFFVKVATALSAWANYTHTPDPQGRWFSALLPILASAAFHELLRSVKEAADHKSGRNKFQVRPALLAFRLLLDRRETWKSIKSEFTNIGIQNLIGTRVGELAVPVPTPVDESTSVLEDVLVEKSTRTRTPKAGVPVPVVSDNGVSTQVQVRVPRQSKIVPTGSDNDTVEIPRYLGSVDQGLIDAAEDLYLEESRRGAVPGIAAIKSGLQVGQAKATQVQTHLKNCVLAGAQS